MGIFMVISSPWWGKRNDRRGFKKNLIFAVTGAGLSYLLHGMSTLPSHLVILRAILGFCFGGILPTLYTYISQHTPYSRRGGIMGIASSATILGNVIGPTTGGYLAARIGIRGCFYVAGGMLLAAAGIVLKYLDNKLPSETEDTTAPTE
jgi:MFS family permease